jgi:hypothetical protein
LELELAFPKLTIRLEFVKCPRRLIEQLSRDAELKSRLSDSERPPRKRGFAVSHGLVRIGSLVWIEAVAIAE